MFYKPEYNRKIAIIDPVGIKAGMNCYDLGLLNALNETGFESFVFSNFNDKNYSNVNQYNYFLPVKKGTVSNIKNFFAAHIKALYKCRKQNIEWVILHVFSSASKDYYSFRFCKLFKRNIIAIIHDVESLSKEDNSNNRIKMYDMASMLIVHNQTSLQLIQQNLSKANNEKLKVIPHGNYISFVQKDTSSFKTESDIDFDEKYKYILFFGQIKKVKGLDILLEALPYLDDNIKLIIAGRPHRDDYTLYSSIIKKNGSSKKVIELIRFITDEERDYLFKKCDLLILPYRKIFQSGVLLTALSYRLPVIASDLPANAEIIKDGFNGFLFRDGDAKDLSEKINYVLSLSNLEAIRKAAYNTAKHDYSWSLIAQQYSNAVKNN